MNNDIIEGFDNEKEQVEGIEIQLQAVETIEKCLVFNIRGCLYSYTFIENLDESIAYFARHLQPAQ